MTSLSLPHSDEETARARIDRIATHVSAALQDIIDAHRERDWIALGYESWDALCDAEFRGATVGLPRGERRDAVAEMTSAGMSTRAIGTALGVGVATVHRDRDSGVPNGTPVTGLDGKTYQPRTTVEVDTQTGEILTEQEWREQNANALGDMLSADPGIRAANISKRFVEHLKHMGPPPLMDPEEAAEIVGTDDFRVESLRYAKRSLDEWCQRFESALTSNRRLRVVEGN